MGRHKIIDDDALLVHARTVFLERGAYGSTKDIAQRAGISEAAIFQRFPTKAELFLAAMMPPQVDATAIVASEIEDIRLALLETGRRMLGYFREIIPTVMHLMTHPAISMADVARHYKAMPPEAITIGLAAFLAKADADGRAHAPEPLATAGLFVSAVHSLAVYELMEIHVGEDAEHHAVPMFVNALWTGLDPCAEERSFDSRRRRRKP